jgi:hypothetical protein
MYALRDPQAGPAEGTSSEAAGELDHPEGSRPEAEQVPPPPEISPFLRALLRALGAWNV